MFDGSPHEWRPARQGRGWDRHAGRLRHPRGGTTSRPKFAPAVRSKGMRVFAVECLGQQSCAHRKSNRLIVVDAQAPGLDLFGFSSKRGKGLTPLWRARPGAAMHFCWNCAGLADQPNPLRRRRERKRISAPLSPDMATSKKNP